MKNVIQTVSYSYSLFMGEGMYIGLLFGSLIYIFANKNTTKNIEYIFYYIVAILFVILNPLVAFFVNDIYYIRFIQILPAALIIAYAGTCILLNIQEKAIRIIGGVALYGILAISGSLVFNDNSIIKADNQFKVSNDIVLLADTITLYDGNPMVLASDDIQSEFRRYEARIRFPYDLTTINNLSEINMIREQLNGDNPDLDYLVDYSNRYGCNFIILNTKEINLIEKMRKLGFEFIPCNGNKQIYVRK